MTICYFGTYDPTYTRNRINLEGLRRQGMTIIECRTDEKSKKKYGRLIRKHWAIRQQYQVMVVGFAGHAIMPLAWLLCKLHRKKLVLDLFVSEYDSVILDRKAFSPRSWQAKKYWLMDWLACTLADRLLLETDSHIDFFSKTFKIKRSKFRRLIIGADESIFNPAAQPSPSHDEFIVHFHGSYAPVQGVSYIIDAAANLKAEPIRFNIIGKKTNYRHEIERAESLGLSNITFVDALPYDELARQMSDADVCLGMFGDVPKTQFTSAFKIIEAMALRKPVITAETRAMREQFTDRVHCLFCKAADGKDLAEKIMTLKNDPDLATNLARNGYELFKAEMTPASIGNYFLEIIKQLG